MNESGFRDWLTMHYKPNTVSTKLSECRNLCACVRRFGSTLRHRSTGRRHARSNLLGRRSSSPKAQSLQVEHIFESISRPQQLSHRHQLLPKLSGGRLSKGWRSTSRHPGRKQAMDEYDALGFDAFMEAYNFGSSISYWVLRDGKRYPSKAIFDVAHQFIPNGAPLDNEGCSGTDARKLAKAADEIIGGRSSRRPHTGCECPQRRKQSGKAMSLRIAMSSTRLTG